MNKIVREHYPASRLPADLRETIGENEKVTVTIVVEELPSAADEPSERKSWFERYKHLRRSRFQSTDEVNEYIRSLRDEWSQRER